MHVERLNRITLTVEELHNALMVLVNKEANGSEEKSECIVSVDFSKIAEEGSTEGLSGDDEAVVVYARPRSLHW